MKYLKTFLEGAMINKRSLDQLKKVWKKSKKTDIGDKTNSKQNAPNQIYCKSSLDGKIQTYEEFNKEQKQKFGIK